MLPSAAEISPTLSLTAYSWFALLSISQGFFVLFLCQIEYHTFLFMYNSLFFMHHYILFILHAKYPFFPLMFNYRVQHAAAGLRCVYMCVCVCVCVCVCIEFVNSNLNSNSYFFILFTFFIFLFWFIFLHYFLPVLYLSCVMSKLCDQ